MRQLNLGPADLSYAEIRRELRRLSTQAANANHMDVSNDNVENQNPTGPN